MTITAALISVRPQYAEAMLKGEKTVELRRVRPRLDVGVRIFLYSTLPVSSIVGSVLLREIVEASPGQIWNRFGKQTGVTRHAFESYFAGPRKAVGLRVSCPSPLAKPVLLAELREVVPLFQPPQLYHYLRTERPSDLQIWSHLESCSNDCWSRGIG